MPLVIATDIGEVKHVSKVVAEYVNESLTFFQKNIDKENNLKKLLFEEVDCCRLKRAPEKIINKEDRSKQEPNNNWNTLFIFLMKNVDRNYRESRELMIQILFQFFKESDERNKCFVKLIKVMSIFTCDFDGKWMEELIELFQPELEFAQILQQTGPNLEIENKEKENRSRHNIMMSMAKYERDEALSEFLTNRQTSKLVSVHQSLMKYFYNSDFPDLITTVIPVIVAAVLNTLCNKIFLKIHSAIFEADFVIGQKRGKVASVTI